MRPNQKPKVVSLFTGAGGLDLGLEAAGFDIRLCVENDEDARKTLAQNYPRWKLSEPGDIFEISPTDILRQADLDVGSVDLIAAGFPCQPFSAAGNWSAGRSRGFSDPRSATLMRLFEMVSALRPKTFLIENVPGFGFRNSHHGISIVKKLVKRINNKNKTQYRLSIHKMNCANYGVPQKRIRLIIVGNRDGRSFFLPPETHVCTQTESYGSCENAFVLTAWDALHDLPDQYSEELEPVGKWAPCCQLYRREQTTFGIQKGEAVHPYSGGEPAIGHSSSNSQKANLLGQFPPIRDLQPALFIGTTVAYLCGSCAASKPYPITSPSLEGCDLGIGKLAMRYHLRFLKSLAGP